MKKILIFFSWLLLITSFPVYADSIVRIQCEDEDVGTEIFFNDKFVGECPIDASVNVGTVQLRARKIVKNDYEKLFEKTLRVVDGVSQRVEITLSAPQLTSEAKLRNETAQANTLLRSAEAGDIEAMKMLAKNYDAGTGVKKDPAKAALWRNKADAATAQVQLRAAEAGDIEAMKKMAYFYDAGIGVNVDLSQGRVWREKADAAKREKMAKEETARREAKELNKQQRIDRKGPFNRVKSYLTDIPFSEKVVSGPTTLPVILVTDIISLPLDLTERQKILNEAVFRPSTWGKPESMIARASMQQKSRNARTENLLFVAAVK